MLRNWQVQVTSFHHRDSGLTNIGLLKDFPRLPLYDGLTPPTIELIGDAVSRSVGRGRVLHRSPMPLCWMGLLMTDPRERSSDSASSGSEGNERHYFRVGRHKHACGGPRIHVLRAESGCVIRRVQGCVAGVWSGGWYVMCSPVGSHRVPPHHCNYQHAYVSHASARARTFTCHAGLRSVPSAGSCSGLDVAFRRLVNVHGRPLADAVAMCCTNPARIAGLKHVGTLEPGKRADMLLMDGTLGLQRVIVAGIVAHDADATADSKASG